MTGKQRDLFNRIYKFLHDEKMNCMNLAAMINIEFPEPIDNEISLMMHAIREYLEMRSEVGEKAMNMIYDISSKLETG